MIYLNGIRNFLVLKIYDNWPFPSDQRQPPMHFQQQQLPQHQQLQQQHAAFQSQFDQPELRAQQDQRPVQQFNQFNQVPNVPQKLPGKFCRLRCFSHRSSSHTADLVSLYSLWRGGHHPIPNLPLPTKVPPTFQPNAVPTLTRWSCDAGAALPLISALVLFARRMVTKQGHVPMRFSDASTRETQQNRSSLWRDDLLSTFRWYIPTTIWW